ncbi:putative multi antimicrobial extrusion protein [Medicago truncatula]|uniref:Protein DETOXIFICATION n=1 Tax=Medicago truncatula TaxID=3880 RepID=G7IZF7_MEDTR|nr:protein DETOXIFICATION 43 [Medicago truncatula]XP_024635601.1 protein DETOXIFICATION 43 [Medicago truncatula]XP_039688357.1 protein DETOXIFICATION 43 [Medicago truncatula]AES69401.1 MATE efflux family protein [Medicago truncatula]RHN66216.1 putative multi antimicrobial extrusion protein [Medicago truncatula]
MDDNDISNNAVKNKWTMPLSVFFKDASLVFKMDSLAKEILGIAFPSALAVAADPIASLIDTAFIGHLGPVELAAAGVSIAVFNQASRITIFPLVSITTSFVAEEDTMDRINTKAAEKQFNESGKAKSNEVMPDDHLLQDIEAGATKQDSTLKNGDDANSNISKSSIVTNSSNKSESKPIRKKRHIASASTALLFGTVLGLIQAATLIFAAKPLLGAMGLKYDSPMLVPAVKYLRLRALGAPAVLLSLAMQGIFRGFKDTTTPLYVIVSGYALNVAMDPLLIFYFKLGIRGAAISHVLSQYIMATLLLFILMKKVDLLPPSMKDLQIFRFLKNGGLLLARVIAVTFCVTLSASLAARLGPIPMAAFQTCLQVWMTSSLLADGLAVAIQAILACSFAEKDYNKVTTAATRTLQMSFVLGVGLSLVVGGGLYFGAGVFSKNVAVIHLIRLGLPFVAATQPINSLAFVFDGVNYGASDFAYSAYSLVMVSIASVTSLFFLYKSKGFIGIWIALTIYMSLRMFAGVWRMGTGTGPWRFLRGQSLS